MEKEKTIITLLIELDKILKLENKQDAMNALYRAYPTYSETDQVRVNYARNIYNARKLLGLSVEFSKGALFAEEEVSEINALLQKANQEPLS